MLHPRTAIAPTIRLADLPGASVPTIIDHQLEPPRERRPLGERSRGSESISDTEAKMRRKTLVLAAFIMAGIGLSMLTYVAANPERNSAAKPAIASVSPLGIMQELGKDLPAAKDVDPF
jgi:hypothetical protein